MTVTCCGLFEKDKYISMTGAVSNLVISLILVRYFGISGVILGTIGSQLIQMVLKARLVFKEYFLVSCKGYLLRISACFAIFVIELVITNFCCGMLPEMNAIISFIIKMFICVVVPNLITVALFYKTDDFKYLLELINRVLKKNKMH